jgi:hypothetical protein
MYCDSLGLYDLTRQIFKEFQKQQCYGSGSVGCVCFGPPETGSVVFLCGSGFRSGSGSFHQQTKKIIQTLISAVYSDFLMTLSLQTDVNIPTESKKQNKF